MYCRAVGFIQNRMFLRTQRIQRGDFSWAVLFLLFSPESTSSGADVRSRFAYRALLDFVFLISPYSFHLSQTAFRSHLLSQSHCYVICSCLSLVVSHTLPAAGVWCSRYQLRFYFFPVSSLWRVVFQQSMDVFSMKSWKIAFLKTIHSLWFSNRLPFPSNCHVFQNTTLSPDGKE